MTKHLQFHLLRLQDPAAWSQRLTTFWQILCLPSCRRLPSPLSLVDLLPCQGVLTTFVLQRTFQLSLPWYLAALTCSRFQWTWVVTATLSWRFLETKIFLFWRYAVNPALQEREHWSFNLVTHSAHKEAKWLSWVHRRDGKSRWVPGHLGIWVVSVLLAFMLPSLLLWW